MPALRHPDPAWRWRLTLCALGVLLLWPMLVLSEFKPWILFDRQSLSAAGRFLQQFLRPALDGQFLLMVLRETWQTVAIATCGLTLALLGAIPATLIVTERLSISRLGTGRMGPLARLVRQAVRWLLVLLRSVPELVWALVFVRVVGLGPTSGVLAIALTYGGMLGKVYADILESGDSHASSSLMRNGAGRLQAFSYALLPQNASELTSYTVYRWECAIRSSAVLGFVGAGGLGQLMDSSLKMFNGSEVASILLVFMALVWLADRISAALRKSLA